MKIRKVQITDIPDLNKLYRNTVLTVNRKDYTSDEVEDWASCVDNIENWYHLLEEQHYVLAENKEGRMVGFGSINEAGYMHTLFVHADFQYHGIATLLYQYLEKYAQDKGADKITSEVSITAKPFFEKQGFRVDEEQKRKANKLSLINYKMSKPIVKPLSEMTNEELWQLFPIILSEYQGSWKNDFIVESNIIKSNVCPESILRVNHIGSTAIPGLLAKPIIDILIEIDENANIDKLIQEMEVIGYIYSPQPDKPSPHMMFMKGYTPEGFKSPVYHAHIRFLGDWDEIRFRDYLITHTESAKEYADLKLRLKEKFEHDRDGYTNAKTEFVQKILMLAKQDKKG